MSRKRYALICLLLSSTATLVAEEVPVTTGSLIREMVDLSRLAEFPDPEYRTVQFSSYDRRSRIPDGPDWFANSDGFGKEPEPNFEAVLRPPGEDGIGEFLLCDVAGPGAIVRTWTAAIEGELRLYLDGSSEPVYSGPAQDFLLRPYDRLAVDSNPDKSRLEGTLYQRNAAYCPIPFARGCRIEWIGDPQKIHFYQIQVRRYAAGTRVRTFGAGDLAESAADLNRTLRILSDPVLQDAPEVPGSSVPVASTLEPGGSEEVLSLEGPRAIRQLTLKVSASELDKALRQTVLRISFDGHRGGQVQAPVGDFFGAAPGINPFESVPFSVLPDGTMVGRFPMPFARSATVSLENRGEQPVVVTGSVSTRPYEWKEGVSMHFRARWRIDHDLTASNREVQDLPFLIANGRGVYVGTAVMLLNPTPVPTPGGGWWGEGDEKIFVDDDVQPSTFGTGSEDYFNYAWSAPDIFGFPYCGQPRNDGPGNRGFVTNHRWHVLDTLPFGSRLAFYMELFSHEPTPGVSYARIGYHYALPGAYDDHLPITDSDLRHLQLPPDWQPAARGQARGARFYAPESLTSVDAETALEAGRLWSGGRLLVWHPKPRESREFTLPVADDGPHRIHLGLALDGESGQISVRLDGEEVGFGDDGLIDLRAPHRVMLRQYSSDKVELKKGTVRLEIRFEEGSEAANRGRIGIDYLSVQSVE